VDQITFWQANFRLIASVPAEVAHLPPDAATAVAGMSHMIFRSGITLAKPWVYRATWSDQDGDHEVSTLTRADLALLDAAITLRRQHPDATSVLETRNLLINHHHFPWLQPYHAPTHA
jgi:hypothetical protein